MNAPTNVCSYPGYGNGTTQYEYQRPLTPDEYYHWYHQGGWQYQGPVIPALVIESRRQNQPVDPAPSQTTKVETNIDKIFNAVTVALVTTITAIAITVIIKSINRGGQIVIQEDFNDADDTLTFEV